MNKHDNNIQVTENESAPNGAALLSPRDLPTWTPFTDIFETNEAVVIMVDLPGVEESQLDITLHQNTLEVKGSFVPTGQGNTFRPVWTELTASNFSRRFVLTPQMGREGIQARLNNGVLHITVPKIKEHIATRIPVSAG